MTLSDFTTLASLLSSVAVLISLIFVGVQIRPANRNQRSATQQGRSDRNVKLLSRLTDPKLSELLLRAFRGETLPDAEYLVLYGYISSLFWSYEDSFFQFRSGTLDQKSWASDVASLRRLLRNPAYRAVWKTARDGSDGEYRVFIDGLVAEARSTTPLDLPNILKQLIAEEREAVTKPEKDGR